MAHGVLFDAIPCYAKGIREIICCLFVISAASEEQFDTLICYVRFHFHDHDHDHFPFHFHNGLLGLTYPPTYLPAANLGSQIWIEYAMMKGKTPDATQQEREHDLYSSF